MVRLRVVLFGSGSPMSLAGFEELREITDIVRIVLPQRRRSVQRLIRNVVGRIPDHALLTAVHSAGVPVSYWDDDLSVVSRDRPDVICVATFARILPLELLGCARIGALNVHGSLLPRHRGPDPLFWTYYDSDKETGVTLHWMTTAPDAGPVIAQRRWDLLPEARVTDVYMRQVHESRSLWRDEIAKLERGEKLTGTAQDESLATHEPSPARRTWAIDFATWPLDRVWNFLWGLTPGYDDLLSLGGRPLRIGPDLQSSRRSHDRAPGTLLLNGASFALFCQGGVIEGRRLPRTIRWRRTVSSWLRS